MFSMRLQPHGILLHAMLMVFVRGGRPGGTVGTAPLNPVFPANRNVRQARHISTIMAMVAWAATAASAQDVSSLAAYRPGKIISGDIRIWGDNHMETLVRRWEEGFRKYHPAACFSATLRGTSSAQFGLHHRVADMALAGRQISPVECYGVFRRSSQYPVEIAVATGSFNVAEKSAALTVFVHKDNPLKHITLKQLDGIYGAERTGGWNKLEWRPEVARTAKENLRTWDQLGLTGEWAGKPIHAYGPPGVHPGGVSFFQTRVMGGADTWNEGLLEFPDPEQMMEALGKDPRGIAYAALNKQTSMIRPLGVAAVEGGPYVYPTRESVANLTYPLAQQIYIYFATDTETGNRSSPAIDPKVEEFLRYILSREGQRDVASEGEYLPLTADLVREQLRMLDAADQ